MKFFASAAFAALIFSLPSTAQINASSEITEAVVFLQGAQITREAQVSLQAGDNLVRFGGISNQINPSSIQVSGGDGYIITGTRHQTDFDALRKEPALVRAKRDSLEDARFSKKAKAALRETYQEELAMLQANREINGSQSVLLVEDVEDMANFYRERVKEIKYKTLELEDEESELNERITRLQNELQSAGQLQRRNTSEVLVNINARAPRSVKISIQYVIYDASWVPVYDLRSGGTEEAVKVVLKGKVRQNSGNDWGSIKLSLSSGDPSIGGNPPQLRPWMLYPKETFDKRSAKDAYRTYDAEEAESVVYVAPLIQREDVASQSMSNQVNVQEKVLTAKWSIDQAYDVPSDNAYYEVELQQMEMPADYRHFTVPKMNEDAYLVANVTEWEQYSLLPGLASIYFEGDYVGSSFIDPFVATDTLQLSFGRDPGVVVKREQVKDYCKTKSLGLKKQTQRGYKITVMNTRPVEVIVRVEDQVPVSTDDAIEVAVDELSGGEYDVATGTVTWDKTIAPGETSELELRFSVKYPRKTAVGNL